MSKFDYCDFNDGYDTFAVSKEKYTREEAIEIAKVELERYEKPYYLAVGDGYVRHRAGVNEEREPCVGWWLEYSKFKRSCSVYIFHTTKNKNETFNEDYEYLLIN
jgi:hypothetical protein